MLRFSIALFFMALFLPLSTAQADWRQGMKLPASLAYAEAAVIDGEIYVLRNNRHAGKISFLKPMIFGVMAGGPYCHCLLTGMILQWL